MTDLVPARSIAHSDRVAALIREFLAGKATSPHTADAYRRDLTKWINYCTARDIDPLDAWPAHVQRWLAELAHGDPQVGRAPESGNTRARRLGAVSSWYTWLVRHQAALRNPAQLEPSERPVRAPRRAPALSDAQTEQLLAAADADPNPRTAAIVWLLLTTGIRVGEMIAADVADIGQDRGVTVLHVHGKGGKTRMVEIEPYTMSRVDAYLTTRSDCERRPVPTEQAGAGNVRPLIATTGGRRIDRKAVRRLLRRLASVAGLPPALVDRITPHSTRATYVTTALEDGVPVRDVQLAVGHVSPVTTEGYDRSVWSPDRSPSRRVAKRFHAARVDAQWPNNPTNSRTATSV